MATNNSKRGLASASQATRTRVAKAGNAAQPRAAKAEGGRRSHMNRNR
jgi:hypothetical protein